MPNNLFVHLFIIIIIIIVIMRNNPFGKLPNWWQDQSTQADCLLDQLRLSDEITNTNTNQFKYKHSSIQIPIQVMTISMIVGFGANGATKPNHCEKIELSANQQKLAG